MNVLVTGATGRVGSRFVPRLLQQRGVSVSVLVRRPERAESLRRLGAQVVQGDLLQRDTLTKALERIDTIVHLAAFFRGATDAEAHEVNDTGTEMLADAAIAAGVLRFVFTSTSTVYGTGQSRPYIENDPLDPPNRAYPISKAAAEGKLLRLEEPKGLGLRILRLAFVYGEGDAHMREFLPRLSAWNPAKRLHMVHHADVGQALLRAIRSGTDGGVYNVADDAPISAQELNRLSGQPELPDENSSLPYDPWEMIVDTSRAREELGFRPIYPSFYSALDAGATWGLVRA